jgi:transcriptional regulator with XRE-family HTH domain
MSTVTAKPEPPYGAILADMREERGLTQEQLAALGGITRKTVSRYETGVLPVPKMRFLSLCAVMGYGPAAVEAWLAAFSALHDGSLEAAAAEPLVPGLPPDLDHVIRKAVADLREALVAEAAPRLGRAVLAATWRRERKRAERLAKRLLAAPALLRPLLLAFSPLYCSWPVVEWLCHASEQAAARDPKLALNLAKVGLQAAEACPGSGSPRLQGYAWAFVGNALRVSNDLRGGDVAFAKTWRRWVEGEEGCNLPLAEWRLLDLEASLRRDQRRSSEAMSLLARASAQAPRQAQGRILIKLALVLDQIGEHSQVLETLHLAEPLIDVLAEPRLRWILRCIEAASLLALDRAKEAHALLPEIQRLVDELGNHPDLLRTLWIRGRVNCMLGRLDDARASLEQVLAAFSEARLAYDAALAGLDLALVQLQRGELQRVRDLAEEMVWVFNDPDFAQEGLAALRIFWEAARQERATATLACETWAAVKRAGLSPRITRTA